MIGLEVKDEGGRQLVRTQSGRVVGNVEQTGRAGIQLVIALGVIVWQAWVVRTYSAAWPRSLWTGESVDMGDDCKYLWNLLRVTVALLFLVIIVEISSLFLACCARCVPEERRTGDDVPLVIKCLAPCFCVGVTANLLRGGVAVWGFVVLFWYYDTMDACADIFWCCLVTYQGYFFLLVIFWGYILFCYKPKQEAKQQDTEATV